MDGRTLGPDEALLVSLPLPGVEVGWGTPTGASPEVWETKCLSTETKLLCYLLLAIGGAVFVHRFCGVKIETDHIRPAADGGDDSIANAIPVCFDCHAEIHSYNEKHPRGRKFTAEELARHKAQWLDICVKPPS